MVRYPVHADAQLSAKRQQRLILVRSGQYREAERAANWRRDRQSYRRQPNQVLINNPPSTAPLSGFNTDPCVLHSLTNANFPGHGCVLVEDLCATTSPDLRTEATIWSVRKCFGFVADSAKMLMVLWK